MLFFSVPAPLTSRVFFTCSNEATDTLQFTDYHMKTMQNASLAHRQGSLSTTLSASQLVKLGMLHFALLFQSISKATELAQVCVAATKAFTLFFFF